MTYEEQLDEALNFLVTWKCGSFKYYLHNGLNIGENFPELKIIDERDKLEWYLKSVGIDEQFVMSVIYHLIHDGYVEPNWQKHNSKENGNPPDQIKITWKGIIFWNNGKGGYKNEGKLIQQNEELEKRQTQSVIETNENQVKFSKSSLLLAFISTLFILSTLILSFIDKTPQRLQDIENALRSQDSTLKKIQTSIEKTSSSIQKVTSDTIMVKGKN